MNNIQFNGGLFHPQIETRRAQATCRFDDTQLCFETEHGQFTLRYEDANVRIGGSSDRMIFVENDDKSICFFSEDPSFIKDLQESQLQKTYEICLQNHRKEQHTTTIIWGSIFAVACLVLYLVYRSIPHIAIASLQSIPISVDEQLGKLSASQMDHGGTEIHDPRIVEPIQSIVQKLSASQQNTSEDLFEFDVHIIKSDIQNAYALPGGYIVLYTGLIEHSSSPEQIAGVLAHEMAHVTERHGLIKVMETAGISAIIALFIGDVEGIISLGAQLLSYSTVNSYSRDSETQADEVGCKTMYDANINPTGMIDFFGKLESNDDIESEIIKNMPTWMQSHPKHQERITHIQAILDSYPQKEYQSLDIDFEALQQAIQEK